MTKKQAPQFQTAYAAKPRVQFSTKDTRTEQSHKQECDINYILAKHLKTGVINHQNAYGGQYGDTSAIDYHSAMNTIINADKMFNDLPSGTRTRFQNDPAQFLDFVGDENNLEEMYTMGLAIRPEKPANAEVSPAMKAAAETEAKPKGEADKTVTT